MPDVSSAGRLHRRALPRCVARGGGARDQQAARGGAQLHRRRQAHHVAQLRGPRPGERGVHAQRRHEPRDAGAARQVALVQAAFPRDAKPPTIARFNTDNAQPVVVMALLSPTRSRARAVDAGRADRRPSGCTRVEGVATVDLGGPGHARGAHRPRPGAAARLRHHAGRDRRPRCARPTPTSRWACCRDRDADAHPARRGPRARPAPLCRHRGRRAAATCR